MWKKDSESKDSKRMESASDSPSTIDKMRSQPTPVAPSMSNSPPKRSSNAGTIAKNVTIKGEILGTADLSVAGVVKGTINIPKNVVIVEEGGRVEATIQAIKVTVNGYVKGNVQAYDTVHIQSNGEVSGDIKAVNVVLENGATFNGSIEMIKKTPTPAAETKPAAPPAPKPAPPSMAKSASVNPQKNT